MRRLDTREPHTCSSEGGCRNILIDLKLTSKLTLSQPVQCKCIDINPIRTEQIAVGALDPYARIYDARLCSLRSSTSASSPHGDPSCIALYAPGHLSNPAFAPSKRSMCSAVAATFVTFSSDGRELLVNLSGEQIYLYDITTHQQPVTYEMDESEATSIPVVTRPVLRTCSANGMAGMGMKLVPPPVFESHSTPQKTAEEFEIDGRVMELKNRGKELYKEERFNDALNALNSAIYLCQNWHMLYFLRGTTLYSRKW